MEGPTTAAGLVRAALRGEDVARVPCGPLAVHFCAHHAGVSLRSYSTDPRLLADCVLGYHEKYHPDAIWISADTWVTAEAMGASVASPGEDLPIGGTGEPLIRRAADIDRIPPPDPDAQGRFPLMQEAFRAVAAELGGQVFIVGCFDQSPLSLAGALLGMEELMLKLVDDRPMVDALLERSIDYCVAYGAALARSGADMLSTGDSPAGLLGPARYREAALPAERRVFAGLREMTDRLLSLHICGDTTAILADMATSGADVLEIDHQVDIGLACRTVGPGVGLWGNLDPVGVLRNGTPSTVEVAATEVLEAVRRHRHGRFVLSSGCTLAPDTPEENLRALFRTAGLDDGGTAGRRSSP